MLSEVIDFGGESRRDMGVAEVFSHNRAVLALGQGVVVGTPGPRAGELPDVQLVEQPGDLMVDELRAVVGMEAFDDEGERAKEGFEHREQEVFADALHRSDELELCDLVDQIDVVQALGTVEVALMDGVHPHDTGTALGVRSASLADADVHRSGLFHVAAAALVSR